MVTKTSSVIFKVMTVIAWLIFVGLCIEAGALLVNFVFSLFNPAVVSKLYQKMDLSAIYNRSRFAYFGVYSMLLGVSILKAYLFYLVIALVSKFNIEKPFDNFVARQITKISYFTLSIGVLGYIARRWVTNLAHHGFDTAALSEFWVDSQAFILMAGVVYVIAMIVAKGVELQTENDLTI